MEIGINYGGHTSQPADDISRDGDLDYVVNLYNENDALNAVQNPFVVSGITPGWRIIYVHSAATYRHLILINESDTTSSMPIGAIAWIDFPSGSEYEANIELESTEQPIGSLVLQLAHINKVVGIGNTIVILTPTETHYILWKSDEAGYTYLGDHLPEVDLQFGLINKRGETRKGVYIHATSEEDAIANDNAILGQVNEYLSEAKEKGLFTNNFYVRYAIRLYDGTVTLHSAPILMVVNSEHVNPVVFRGKGTSGSTQGSPMFCFACDRFKLCYKLLSNINEFEVWEDVVKSVDIYVSPEISNYNASGSVQIIGDMLYLDNQTASGETYYCQDQSFHIAQARVGGQDTFKKFFNRDVYASMGESHLVNVDLVESDDQGNNRFMTRIKLPTFSEEYLKNQQLSTQFYFIKSIPFRELKYGITEIEINDGKLKYLEQPDNLMPDDYSSHDYIIAKNAYVYNSRLNLINVSHGCYGGYNLKTTIPILDDKDESIISPYDCKMYVYIRENGQDVVVRQTINLEYLYLSPFIYYPNPNAYRAVLRITKSPKTGGQITTKSYEFDLHQHEYLNGSYSLNAFVSNYSQASTTPPKFFPDYLTPLENFTPPTEEELQAKWIEYPNKIYTSEVNNPFLFKAEGVNTINTAEILALTSTTKALSQGQFGQFPMYAFTTDGIWALETSSTGGVASLHPVTRDVCTNIESITQIDNAVLFHSARGVMLLQGSETICISDSIDSPTLFNVSKLPQFLKIPNEFMLLNLPRTPFKKFLENSGMLYDYAHQRIVLYQKSDNLPNIPEVSYVYSLKSKTWSLMQTNIKYAINAYPNAIVVGGGERGDNMLSDRSYIINYSHSNPNTPVLAHQMLVTRPLKLDAPFNLKTINTLIQRGNFAKGKVRTILYGSRDLINWHLVASSVDHTLRNFRGTPYKYFRIVALTDLDAGESLTGASILFDVRQNNQLR